MLNLNEKELLEYTKKICVIDDIIETFGIPAEFPSSSIYKKFSLKEFISKDFQENVYPTLVKYTGKYQLNYFLKKRYDGHLGNDILDEDRENALDIILECLSKETISMSYDLSSVLDITKDISRRKAA